MLRRSIWERFRNDFNLVLKGIDLGHEVNPRLKTRQMNSSEMGPGQARDTRVHVRVTLQCSYRFTI